MPSVKIEDCAVVNKAQLVLLERMYGLSPWSYKDEDPFQLVQQLAEQEKYMREKFGLS